MPIKFYTNDAKKKSGHILVPVCVTKFDTPQERWKRFKELEEVISNLPEVMRELNTTPDVVVEFIIADELNRHSGYDVETLRQEGRELAKVILSATEKLRWELEKQFKLSYWRAHYDNERAKKCIAYVSGVINRFSETYNAKIGGWFEKVAQSFALQCKGMAIEGIKLYHGEEYAVAVRWRFVYKNPIMLQGIISCEKRKIMRWVNHLPLDKILGEPNTRGNGSVIQQVTYWDPDKHPDFNPLKQNTSKQRHELQQHSIFAHSPRMPSPAQVDEMLRNFLRAGGTCSLPISHQTIVAANVLLWCPQILSSGNRLQQAVDSAPDDMNKAVVQHS